MKKRNYLKRKENDNIPKIRSMITTKKERRRVRHIFLLEQKKNTNTGAVVAL